MQPPLLNAILSLSFLGLYTSPHLVSMHERFRINCKSVDDATFLRHFWAVWDGLAATLPGPASESTAVSSSSSSALSSSSSSPASGPAQQHFIPAFPGYFGFLTLVAFHMFRFEDIDIVVLEVGLGGRLDPTNVIPPPLAAGREQGRRCSLVFSPLCSAPAFITIRKAQGRSSRFRSRGLRPFRVVLSGLGFSTGVRRVVAAVTPLALEHTEILGNCIKGIAREKAGIFKPNSPAVTCAGQVPEALKVLGTTPPPGRQDREFFFQHVQELLGVFFLYYSFIDCRFFRWLSLSRTLTPIYLFTASFLVSRLPLCVFSGHCG